MRSRHGAEETWDRIWRAGGRPPVWDAQCEVMHAGLGAAFPPIERPAGLSVLEAGAGTGRVTARLAAAGARATVLDVSAAALDIARGVFAEAAPGQGAFVQGSVFELPFEAGRFDLVWNAGLLEHFTPEEKTLALREMLRVTRPGGAVVTMNPYALAVVYRLGKWLKERAGTWPYGYERPVRSLRGVVPAGAGLREFVVGTRYQFRFLPLAGRWLRRWAERRERPAGLGRRLLGGYLLVSVVRYDGGRRGLGATPRR